MENRPVDNSTEPTLVEDSGAGSITEATESLLAMLDAEEAPPATEEEATLGEVGESQPETDDETIEEGGEDESDEGEYEPEDNAEVEGDDSDVYAVKVDGQDVEVSLNELLAGYSRQSDYTRKTQELASERKKIEEIAEQYQNNLKENQSAREQYIQATGQFIAQANSQLGEYAKIDWKALKEVDPIAYVTKRDEFREHQARIQHAQRLQQQAAIEGQKEQARYLEEQVLREHELMSEKVPEWGNQDKRAEMAGKIRSYSLSQGYSEEEVGSLVDHRSLNILLKAMKYDALESGGIRDKKVRNKPTLVKSGTSRSKDSVNRKKRNAQINKLKQTGKAEDAARLLEDLL